MFLSDEGPTFKTLDFTFYIGSTPTFLYFDLYLYSAYAAHYVYKYNRLKIFKQLPAVFSAILAGLKEAQRRGKTQARGTNDRSESFSRKNYDHTVKLCGLCSQCPVHFDLICICHCFYSQSRNFRVFARTTSTWRCCFLELDIVYQRTSLLLIADVQYYIPCSPGILFSMILAPSWLILQLITRQEINTVHFSFPVRLKQIYDFSDTIVVFIHMINRRIDHEFCRLYKQYCLWII